MFNGSRDGKVRTVDLRADSSKEYHDGSNFPILKHQSSISDLQLLSDENYILVSSMDGVICRWDRRILKPVLTYYGHKNDISLISMVVDKNQQFVISGAIDKTVRLWNLSSGILLQQLGPFNQIPRSLALFEGGDLSNFYSVLYIPEDAQISKYLLFQEDQTKYH